MAAAVQGQPKRNRDFSIRQSKGVPVIDETYTYIVVCDTANESLANVYNATGLPLTGRTASPSGYGICKSKRGTQSTINAKYWDVVVTFSTEIEEGQNLTEDTEEPPDPTAWLPIYETKFERMQELMSKDANGDAYVNSVGQAFDNGIARTRLIPYWQLYQFEADTVTDFEILGRNEVVNLTEFYGCDPKTLLCSVNSSVIGFFYGQRLRFTSYTLRYKWDEWTLKKADIGMGVVKADGTVSFDADARGTAKRVSLNGSGAYAGDGIAPAILEFDQFRSVEFGDFLRHP